MAVPEAVKAGKPYQTILDNGGKCSPHTSCIRPATIRGQSAATIPRSSGNAALLFGNDDQRRVQPHGQRCDQRVLLGVAQAGEVGGRGHPAFRIDSAVVVSRGFQCRSGQAAKPNKGTRDAMINPGVSNYIKSTKICKAHGIQRFHI